MNHSNNPLHKTVLEAQTSFGGLEQLLDRSPDAIYRFDLHTRKIQFCNHRFRKIFHVDSSPTATIDFAPPAQFEKAVKTVEEELAGGRNQGEAQYAITAPNSTTHWVQDRWVAVRDEVGRPLAVEGVIRDSPPPGITETQFTRSRENALIGNYIVQDGRFTYINDEFARISGYTPTELLGMESLDLVQEEYRRHVRDNAIAMLKGRSTTPSEFCVRDKSGATRWIMETVSSILYEGRPAVLGFFMDITQLREMQGNLSTLGLMVGTISHSLRGCLTGLDAGIYLTETGFYRDRPARIEEGLDVTKLMLDRIRKLVADILYYVKERALEFEEMEVWRFAKEVAVSMETRIRAANIDFVTHLPDDGGVFFIDTETVRAALVNILENAMEACIEDEHRRRHQIIFDARVDGGQVYFTITDNGPGIPADHLNRIFQIFHSTKGKQGTGLGLFVTRKVIRQHGGDITVASPPGEGAQFHISLPRKPPHDL